MSEPRCECGHGRHVGHCGVRFRWTGLFCDCVTFVADPGAGEDKGLLLKNFPVMITEECPRDTIELRDTATGKLKSSIKVSRPVSDTREAIGVRTAFDAYVTKLGRRLEISEFQELFAAYGAGFDLARSNPNAFATTSELMASDTREAQIARAICVEIVKHGTSLRWGIEKTAAQVEPLVRDFAATIEREAKSTHLAQLTALRAWVLSLLDALIPKETQG